MKKVAGTANPSRSTTNAPQGRKPPVPSSKVSSKPPVKPAASSSPFKAAPNLGAKKPKAAPKEKGLAAYLALTPEEKKKRISVSRRIRLLLKQRKAQIPVTSIDSDLEEDGTTERAPPPKRYRRPVEKLLKRIKAARRDEIPSDINLHRRRHRKASFAGAPGTRKQVQIVYDALAKAKKRLQPEVGWNYNKRDKRLLLGFRHRTLSKAPRYFGSVKDLCPRHSKPNSHLPDAIFIFLNIMIFISIGVPFGYLYASDGYIRLIEDMKEYEFERANLPHMGHEGHLFWEKIIPMDTYAIWYYLAITTQCISILLGFVGVYTADQKLHLAYVIGMAFSIVLNISIAADVTHSEFCPKVNSNLKPLLTSLVDSYYEKVEATSENGTHILDSAGKRVEIRTYKAANIMDKMQLSLHCCGMNGISDYTSKSVEVPSSCCTPLWNLNPHCASVIPTDKTEYRAKLQIMEGVDLGCFQVLKTMCVNLHRMMGESTQLLNLTQLVLFIVALTPLVVQARQIRQLKRAPHLRISAGTISQSLQASAGNEGVKTGGGGVRAVVEASKFSEKQQERLQQTRRENLFRSVDQEEESSESSEDSSGELPVHTVNFGELKTLQQFVDTEDKTKLEMPEIDRTVEGFAGRFNILANKNLQSYVSGIFSTTYQNETNAGLEAISQTLEKQFAQHTTDYNWRKLLTKPKPNALAITKLGRKSRTGHNESDDDENSSEEEETEQE